MCLPDIVLKPEYRTLKEDIVKDFYIPLLSKAKLYKRAVGYFSSTVLKDISYGIAKLAQNQGKILMVASPNLSHEDIEAIAKGYDNRNKIIERAISTEINKIDEYHDMDRLNLLANLISDGVMDIRFAVTLNNQQCGIYHEKMGIIEDEQGNKVAFSGSLNETSNALNNNYESIDVFCSWNKGTECERVKLKDEAFERIWNDTEQHIEVYSFPSVQDLLIERFKKGPPDYKLDEKEFIDLSKENQIKRISRYPKFPQDLKLHPYQQEAVDNFAKENFRGIFDMATGTGKTITALASIVRCSESVHNKLAVVILCPYQHLVTQWVEDITRFNINPIIGFSSSPQKDWETKLRNAIADQKFIAEKSFFCFISTNKTFTSQKVQSILNKIKAPILLVADEAHNLGATSISKHLDERFTYRLALSATLDRHHDEGGTELLYNFFGNKCIEYDLKTAIKNGFLTKYNYYPVLVYLTEDELDQYHAYTTEIAKNIIYDKDGNTCLTIEGKKLALQRSRLVAGAQNKLSVLKQEILPYKDSSNILVYCGATTVYDEDHINDDLSKEKRQIEAVVNLLGNGLGMKVHKFTAEEGIEDRESIKSNFESQTLQAIVAIKCLDEGVNIPGIKTAFILASSTNPKEYVQRRGRVLRLYPGKHRAEIFDFITLPRRLDSVANFGEETLSKELTQVKHELSRLEEFADCAENKQGCSALIDDIKMAYAVLLNNDEENYV